MVYPPQTFRFGLRPKFYAIISMVWKFFRHTNFCRNWLMVKSRWRKNDPQGSKIGFFEKKSKKCGGCVGNGSNRSKMDLNNIWNHSRHIPPLFRLLLKNPIFGPLKGPLEAKITQKVYFWPIELEKIDFWGGQTSKTANLTLM